MNIRKLEMWYQENHRKLSFRETKNPYHIWVSEIMLQQTQVDTVLPYFEKFILRFPTINDLAEVEEEVLIKHVEGLGYYRRFRNMHLAAKKIVSEFQGVFPSTYENVLSLPGVGKYTAGAIMSIAYNKPYSALDGNVIRVLSRYLGNQDDMRLEKNKKRLDQINQSYIEKGIPEVYTQAMMELGATLCKPKNPLCENCPLVSHCVAYEKGIQNNLPFLTKLKSPKEFRFITLIIHDDHYIYLRKRDEELLKGMYEYPQYMSESISSVEDELMDQNVVIKINDKITSYKHVFSHQIWLMDVYDAILISGVNPNWVKVTKDNIKNLPMAIAHRKIMI